MSFIDESLADEDDNYEKGPSESDYSLNFSGIDESMVSESVSPKRAALAVASSNSTAPLRVGVQIEARHSGGSSWYPGKISHVSTDGHGEMVYGIAYDDGDKETLVKRYRVRRRNVGGRLEEQCKELNEHEAVDVRYQRG